MVLAQLDMVAVYEAKAIYDSLVQAYPTTLGKAVSKKERDESGMKDSTLVYGEIMFETFGTIIEKIKKIYGKPNVGASGPSGVLQSRGGIFYDLGSGTGKVVIAAAVLHNFDVCYGIETLEGLFAVSLDCLNTYNLRGKAKLQSRENDTRTLFASCFSALIFALDCQMIHGDFLKTRTKDWRDADVVLANSTCYDEATMSKMSKIARKLLFLVINLLLIASICSWA